MFRSICLVVATGLLVAYATPPKTMALPTSFWQDKGAKIGVAMVALPQGAVHMVGPQDLLDKAIANATDASPGLD